MADEKSRGDAKINERSDLASTTIIESNEQCSNNNHNNNNDNIRKISNKINRQSRNGKGTRNNTSGNNNGSNNRRVRKRKRRFEAAAAAPSTSEKLPTPPPDPRDFEKRRKSLEVDDAVDDVSANEGESQQQSLDRVRCLESAFQQLAEWHSLCEQMLELRDSNSRLFQRVRELERCKVARLLEYYLAQRLCSSDDDDYYAANELEADYATDKELNFQLSIISSILEQSSSSSHQHQSHTSSASSPSLMAAVWPSSANNNNNYKSSPSSQEQLGVGSGGGNVVVSRAKSFRSPVLRQRSRSIGEVQPLANHSGASSNNKRSSCQIQCGGPYYTGYGGNKSCKRNSIVGPIVGTFSGGSTGPKVSKWTKVKAAFKWEKANMGVAATAGAAAPPTSFSSVVLEAIEHEAAQRQLQQNRLKPPETTTTTGLQIDNVATATTTTTTTTTTPNSGSSPRTYEHSGPPSPDSISSSSSIDDIFDSLRERKSTKSPSIRETIIADYGGITTQQQQRCSGASYDGEFVVPSARHGIAQLSRDSMLCRRMDKGHRTAWGKVKEIIQSRKEGSTRRQSQSQLLPRNSLRSEDGYSISSLESSEILNEMLGGSDQNLKQQHREQQQVSRSQTTATTSICLEVPSSSASQTSKPASPVAEVDLEPSSRRLTPTLTLTLPSSEELRSVSSPESTSPRTSRSFHHHQHQHSNSATDASERSPSEDPDSTSSPKQTSCNRHRYGFANPTRRKSLVTMFPTSLSSAAIGGNSSKPQQQQQHLQRHDSKWNKVKRAFLSGASSVPPSPSRISSFFDETDGGGGYSASAEDLDNNNYGCSGGVGVGGASPTHVQTDIQRNAQILHDKLSVEFNRKMIEWNRLQQQKHQQQQQQCGSSRSVGTTSPKDKDSANMLLMGEEQLTPEFKKKLQEWKRMKKGTTSTQTQTQGGGAAATTTTSSPDNQLFRKRLSDWQIWRTNGKSSSSGDNNGREPAASYSEIGKTGVSDEFLKKMEEWKKIKSGRSDFEEQSGGKQKHQLPRRSSDATPPQANFQDQGWSTIDEEEFQPLDKFIHSLEREQARMEKQREKYAKEKSRQNELRSRFLAANSSNNVKKEILVQTSTGSYLKFHGISQEFKKKLFEWEQSRGIAPESSTLKLLDPIQKTYACDESLRYKSHPAVLKRSKSMSSVTEKDSREETAKRQPSCVSLTQLTNLEKPALEKAQRCESKRTELVDHDQVDELLSLTRAAAIDSDEPGAVIVDIEDVIEETASPMAKLQPQQQPVYSVQTSVTTSIAVPVGTVTACSHEPGPLIIVRRDDRDQAPRYKDHRRYKKRTERMEIDEIGSVATVQDIEQQQQQQQPPPQPPNDSTEVHDENRKRKFETTEMKVYETIVEEDAACCTTSLAATGEACEVAKKKPPPPAESASSQSDVTTSLEAKLDELLKKSTSAAAVTTAAADFKDRERSTSQRFNEMLPRVNGDSEILDKSRANHFTSYNVPLKKSAKSTAIYVADETKEVSSSSSSEGARKLHDYCPGKDQAGTAATEDDVVITVNNSTRQKKVLKTRRLTDTQVGYEWRQQQQQHQSHQDTAGPAAITVSKFAEVPSVERIIINEDTLNKIVVPTASNERISSSEDGHGAAGEVVASSPRHSSAVALRENNCSDLRQIRDSSSGGGCSNKERANVGGGGDVKPESTNVFVKTKRIIFSPFSRRSNKDKTTAVAAENETKREEQQPVVAAAAATTNSKSANSSPAVTARPRVQQSSIQKSKSSHDCACVGDQTKRPPLPQSPIFARKDYHQQQQQQQQRKDAPAPSIRKMIQRYNQKLQEDASSPASSGSGSPIWRSPTSERRVRQQMERYQEEVSRALATGTTTTARPGGVEKSASTSVVMQQQQRRGAEILKSVSTTTMSNEEDEQQQQQQQMMMNQERRKSSLKNAEIFSNIQQCLTQEYTILPIKSSSGDSPLLPAENAIGDTAAAADAAKSSVQQSTEFVVQVASGNDHNVAAAATTTTTTTTSLGNISPELIYKLDALSSAAAAAANRDHRRQANFTRLYPSENSTTTTPLRWVRAQRIKQAKDDFFSREPNNFYPLCSGNNSNSSSGNATTTRVESRFRNRHSDASTTMNDNAETAAVAATVSSSNSEFVKSASAGMINVDSRTYQRLSSASSTSNDNDIRHSSNKIEKSSSSSTTATTTTTTTTTTSSSVVEVTGTLSRIASKFRRAKLKRGSGGGNNGSSGHKEAAGSGHAAGVKMSTVSMLCRQSLLVDLHPTAAAAAATEMTSSKSCPTSPGPLHRDDDDGDGDDVYRTRYKNHRDSN